MCTGWKLLGSGGNFLHRKRLESSVVQATARCCLCFISGFAEASCLTTVVEWRRCSHLMRKKKIDFDAVREIALVLPDVEESTIHGALSLKVGGKLLACPALHESAEPNTLAVRIGFDERAKLIAAEPNVYYVTDHYVNYATVLVRLSKIDWNSLRDLLSAAWRFVGPPAKTTRRQGTNQSHATTTTRRSR